MSEKLDSASRYRQRAEELRAIAEDTKDGRAKKALLEVAEEYDRMAETRERVDKLESQRNG